MLSKHGRLYSTAEVAGELSVDNSTVRRWVDSGKLACYRTLGGHRRFAREQVEAFITKHHLDGIGAARSSNEDPKDV